MTSTTPDKYAAFECLREQAVALRREGLSRRQIRDRLFVDNNDLLNRLLNGEPAPEWTKRPNAKDDLRARARELRTQGMTYDQIQAELGCSKSSISLWVRDLPKPAPRTREEASAIARRGWEATLARREEERRRTKQDAESDIGKLSDRELFLAGVVLYWAEGAKDKPWARRESLKFINSDPNVIKVYLRWLELQGVAPERLRLCVNIHESADVEEATRFWAELTGIGPAGFNKPVLKLHNPKTLRRNTGDTYRGCLAIYVRDSVDLYRRMEGAWYGIVGAALATDESKRT
ncbi:helix-turn-helix domain-containing protein [Streptomyces sp. NPDC048111]|uniref:helix-turn-helix domain-containing protein n=1 Tax=Streptomyces sp. NPDC048111 TaxID=3365500 RepID=UPI003711E5F4